VKRYFSGPQSQPEAPGALVKDYKLDARQLSARAANIAPAASNASEAGRAENRRVELVEQ
jgi:OOP family OmpA-OmpF porin